MLEPWNNSSIQPPPINMFLCSKKIDISALKHVCNNIIKVLSKQSPLHKESALCSRFLYKYDRKFSNDIGYRNFRKVHTGLKKYLALNLLKDIEYFLSALPSENDDEKYLPTRQMLEYIMLRIITFSKIMLRICICSKQSAIFYLNRLKRGESYWMSFLPYALLSRLWSMAMVLVQHCTNWFSNLYPYLNILELKGVKFLPDKYELPQDLEQWLDLKNVDNFGRFYWDQKKLINMDNVLLDDDEETDLLDNILNFVNQFNKNELEDLDEKITPLLDECKSQLKNTMTISEIDYGTVMSRDCVRRSEGEVIHRKSYELEHSESRESFKIDQGEVLSRESFKVLLNSQYKTAKENNQLPSGGMPHLERNIDHTRNIKQKKEKIHITKAKDQHTHMKVTNSDLLKKFIKTEEKLRNECDIKSLTGHLSLMQWHSLKNALLKLCDALTNRKIEKKFQRIWKEKCLDYK